MTSAEDVPEIKNVPLGEDLTLACPVLGSDENFGSYIWHKDSVNMIAIGTTREVQIYFNMVCFCTYTSVTFMIL